MFVEKNEKYSMVDVMPKLAFGASFLQPGKNALLEDTFACAFGVITGSTDYLKNMVFAITNVRFELLTF